MDFNKRYCLSYSCFPIDSPKGPKITTLPRPIDLPSTTSTTFIIQSLFKCIFKADQPTDETCKTICTYSEHWAQQVQEGAIDECGSEGSIQEVHGRGKQRFLRRSRLAEGAVASEDHQVGTHRHLDTAGVVVFPHSQDYALRGCLSAQGHLWRIRALPRTV